MKGAACGARTQSGAQVGIPTDSGCGRHLGCGYREDRGSMRRLSREDYLELLAGAAVVAFLAWLAYRPF